MPLLLLEVAQPGVPWTASVKTRVTPIFELAASVSLEPWCPPWLSTRSQSNLWQCVEQQGSPGRTHHGWNTPPLGG